MMYIVFIIDHIHHLMNEFKILMFAYKNDRKVYISLKHTAIPEGIYLFTSRKYNMIQ